MTRWNISGLISSPKDASLHESKPDLGCNELDTYIQLPKFEKNLSVVATQNTFFKLSSRKIGEDSNPPIFDGCIFCQIGREKNHQADREFQTLPAEVWAWSGSWGGRRDAIFGGQSKWGAKAKLTRTPELPKSHNSYIIVIYRFGEK